MILLNTIRRKIKAQVEWLCYRRAREKRIKKNEQDKIIDMVFDTFSPMMIGGKERHVLKFCYSQWRLMKDLSTFENITIEAVMDKLNVSNIYRGGYDARQD